MKMEVEILKKKEDLEQTMPFRVECLLWGTKDIPKTYGYLGFLPGDGFYLKMICEEKNPLRTYWKNQEPVYRDSAMEAFFMFESSGEASRQSGDQVYLNFEANANGALLAGYGKERMYRSCFSKEIMEQFACKADRGEDFWSVSLRIPQTVLERIYGPLDLGPGSSFACNFYKLSETESIEHYASYSPIKTQIPSFHLPEYFASAQIIDKGI